MPKLPPPLDETKLALIRRFLREHFPAYAQRDSVAFDGTAQRFTLDRGSQDQRVLVVPRGTLDDPDLASLLNDSLVDMLKLAGAAPVFLTYKGPRY